MELLPVLVYFFTSLTALVTLFLLSMLLSRKLERKKHSPTPQRVIYRTPVKALYPILILTFTAFSLLVAIPFFMKAQITFRKSGPTYIGVGLLLFTLIFSYLSYLCVERQKEKGS